jgi:dTDP-4-amino-4,6-dideoxygalactose transaminase
MEAVQGAALGVKLPHLDSWTAARRRIAGLYQEGLPDRVGRPAPIGADHVCHVYAIRTADRDRVRADLTRAGIGTNLHYMTPVHLQPAYAHLGYRAGDFPQAEALARETLSLPIYPEMPDAHVAAVIDAVAQATAGIRAEPVLG